MSEEGLAAFERLKQRLIDAVKGTGWVLPSEDGSARGGGAEPSPAPVPRPGKCVLYFPKPGHTLYIQPDTSMSAIGVFVYQYALSDVEIAALSKAQRVQHIRPISYYGRVLTETERRLNSPAAVGTKGFSAARAAREVLKLQATGRDQPPAEGAIGLEILGCVFALERCDHLMRFASKVVLETDHQNVRWLSRQETPRLVRWAVRLLQYPNVTIVHKPGKEMLVSDLISRMQEPEEAGEDVAAASSSATCAGATMGLSPPHVSTLQHALSPLSANADAAHGVSPLAAEVEKLKLRTGVSAADICHVVERPEAFQVLLGTVCGLCGLEPPEDVSSSADARMKVVAHRLLCGCSLEDEDLTCLAEDAVESFMASRSAGHAGARCSVGLAGLRMGDVSIGDKVKKYFSEK